MIIEFSVTNFRSIKEEQIFSFVAEASKSKADNVFEAKIRQGVDLKAMLKDEVKGEKKSTFETIRFLKAAVIYGANASGKSNVIRAFEVFQSLCTKPNTGNQPIWDYNPFKFDLTSKKEPTIFKISFIGFLFYKYEYEFSFNNDEIISEKLSYYPLRQSRNLFERSEVKNDKIDKIKFGSDLKIQSNEVFKNQLYLPLFGYFQPHPILSKIYNFINSQFIFFNTDNKYKVEKWKYEISELLVVEDILKKKLTKLIRIADTKITNLELEISDETNPKWMFSVENVYEPVGIHKIKNSEQTERLLFNEESRGTNMLYILGGKILEQLSKGGTIFIDEIDTSLHPRLAKFLVMLFQHPKSNPKNAQLIFTTHETTFLDKNLFRREQIWFTEKNEFGETELYSMQDFDNVREDTPFEKWYLAGKFGGVPNIKALEFIFSDEETEN